MTSTLQELSPFQTIYGDVLTWSLRSMILGVLAMVIWSILILGVSDNVHGFRNRYSLCLAGDDVAPPYLPPDDDVACTDWWGHAKSCYSNTSPGRHSPDGMAFFKHFMLPSRPIRYMWNNAIAFLASRTLKSIFYFIAWSLSLFRK